MAFAVRIPLYSFDLWVFRQTNKQTHKQTRKQANTKATKNTKQKVKTGGGLSRSAIGYILESSAVRSAALLHSMDR